MNERQAATLQLMMQDKYPDAVVTVSAQDNGAEITICGQVASPGLSGSGKDNNVRLNITDDGPFMRDLITNLLMNSDVFKYASEES